MYRYIARKVTLDDILIVLQVCVREGTGAVHQHPLDQHLQQTHQGQVINSKHSKTIHRQSLT